MAEQYTGTFRPDILLHIEDEQMWQRTIHRTLNSIYSCVEGEDLKRVESNITSELDQVALSAEIQRIEAEMTETQTADRSTIITVMSGQIARTLINKYLPSVIISDTGFPLNGEKTVQWLMSHGLQNYPLIGLSGTTLDELIPAVKDFFVVGNARYFNKDDMNLGDLVNQIKFNRTYMTQNSDVIINSHDVSVKIEE